MILIVSPLSRVTRIVADRSPSHLITLLDPASMIPTPTGVAPERHLKLGVNDIVESTQGLVCPDANAVSRIIDFAEDWDGERPLLIHCWAGISRSTATAYLLACTRSPATSELEIAQALRRASPQAQPNRRIVALADALLDRGGRMSAAIEAIGPGDITGENDPFDLAAPSP